MYETDSRLHPVIAQQPYPLLFVTISGAHLYGFPSPDSDFDLRGIHQLPLPELVGLETGPDTIEQSCFQEELQIDLVIHEAKKFFGLLLKHNGYVLEQLYSPLVVRSTPEHAELKAIAQGCITRYHSHHYLGFANTQWRLFEKENPPRVKPLLYLYRVLLTGMHLMQTGVIEANLLTLNQKFQLPYLDEFIAMKVTGAEKATLATHDVEFHRKEYLRLRQALEAAHHTSHLPNEPSAQSDLHELLLRLRLGDRSAHNLPTS
ncbi:nucleotidyltransferase domain-containing protein [Leptolyngbya sp. AN02str]|uniref:nucleotidyltransferase domain-containing protein n=1 Tax=Leptolyngbya sp. AN02str TaxID=3423363 RepID=UPI003D31EBD8